MRVWHRNQTYPPKYFYYNTARDQIHPDLYLLLILGVSPSNRILLNKNLNMVQFSNFKNMYIEGLLKLMFYRRY